MIHAVSRMVELEAGETLDYCLLEAYKMAHKAIKDCDGQQCDDCPVRHARRWFMLTDCTDEVRIIA